MLDPVLSRFQPTPLSCAHVVVVQFRQMRKTVTIRLPNERAAWLEPASTHSQIPRGRLMREALEPARAGGTEPSWMRLPGSIRGARDLEGNRTHGVFGGVRKRKRQTPPMGSAHRRRNRCAAKDLRSDARRNGLAPRKYRHGLCQGEKVLLSRHAMVVSTWCGSPRSEKRYADQSPELADLCRVRMRKLLARRCVGRIDRTDFRADRRTTREAISIRCLPER